MYTSRALCFSEPVKDFDFVAVDVPALLALAFVNLVEPSQERGDVFHRTRTNRTGMGGGAACHICTYTGKPIWVKLVGPFLLALLSADSFNCGHDLRAQQMVAALVWVQVVIR